jgi:mitochondrial translocator assembly and maintenance protein 41
MLAKKFTPIYNRILSKFPQNFSFCFGYGSGVKKQAHNDGQNKMIDLIFCVDNSYRWHSANLDMNPQHYSALRNIGSNFIAKYQENFGARVYFNTLVHLPDENITIKYGVASTIHLINDLLDWSDLYLAGRLHKPVEIIKSPSSSKVQNAIDMNLKSALHCALLLLPEKFTEYELYYLISSLSYAGDFRMVFGENKNKVENIVRPQLESFRKLYKPTIELFKAQLQVPNEASDNCVMQQCCKPTTILYHLNQLPKWPTRKIVREWNTGKYRQDTEDVLRAVAYYPDYKGVVSRSINQIVWNSSVTQSIKNIPTAGIKKSLDYSWAKVMKTFEN